jgi:hypothetical protein
VGGGTFWMAGIPDFLFDFAGNGELSDCGYGLQPHCG